MKNPLFPALVMVWVLLATLSSCVFEETPEPLIPEQVSFEQHVIPIFEARCSMTACHNIGGFEPDLTQNNSWEALMSDYVVAYYPDSSRLIKSISDGNMKNYATDQDISILIKWIQDGAQNN